MMHKLHRYRKDNRATIGIGAMIVFIAMVLVAGIAASVLIQTMGTLEQKSMTTGQETTAEVSTGLRVVDIEGHFTTRDMPYNTSTYYPWNVSSTRDYAASFKGWHNYSRIHNITLSITPRSGSSDIDLTQTIIEISNSTTKCVLTYDSSQFSSSVSSNGVFSTSSFSLGPDNFGIIEIEDADGSCSSNTPAINRGDRIMLTINASVCFFGLAERTDVWGTIFSEEGASASFAFRTPSSYSDTVYDMFIKD